MDIHHGNGILKLSGVRKAAPNSKYLACHHVSPKERTNQMKHNLRSRCRRRNIERSRCLPVSQLLLKVSVACKKVVAALPKHSHPRLFRLGVWRWASLSSNESAWPRKAEKEQVTELKMHGKVLMGADWGSSYDQI